MENLTGYAEAKILSTIIEAVWFEDMSSHGVIFSTLFKPIPLETMALVMTIVRATDIHGLIILIYLSSA
jgi:hypothetical protein